MANDFVLGPKEIVTDEAEKTRLQTLLTAPTKEETTLPGGMASDTDPMYTQPDKKIGPLERLRLQSEARTGVETTIPRTLARMVGDVFFFGDTREVAKKNALSDIMNGKWEAVADIGDTLVTERGKPPVPVSYGSKAVIDGALNPSLLERKIADAGFDPKEVAAVAYDIERSKAKRGKEQNFDQSLLDAAQTFAMGDLAKRVHVSSRASHALPSEEGENKAGLGYSVIGGGLQNLPYMGSYILGKAIGNKVTSLALPLLASFDRRFQENMESKYLLDPKTGGVKQTEKGMGFVEAMAPSLVGAAGETAIEAAGGELMTKAFKGVTGGILKAVGADKLIRKTPLARSLIKSFDDITKITQVHSLPPELGEEGLQEEWDAGFATTKEYRAAGGLRDRLVMGAKKFGRDLPEIAQSMLLIQAGQVAAAAPSAASAVKAERNAERNAADILKTIPGVDQAKIDAILQDQDARAVFDHIASMSPEEATAAAKRMSARSAQTAEDLKKTVEWGDAALSIKDIKPRFVMPTPDAFAPQRDNTSVYVDPNSNIRLTRDSATGEIEVMNLDTGRTAYVNAGTEEERMQRATSIANAFDRESQGRDIVNNKKREMLAKLLESKGVEGKYVIVDSEDALLAQEALSDKAKNAVAFAKSENGKIPQAFVDDGNKDTPPTTYFVLDNIRMGEGPGAIGKTLRNIVDAATHEPFHRARYANAQTSAIFKDMYDKSSNDLRLDVIKQGITLTDGKEKVADTLKNLAASADDTVTDADSKDKALRRYFEEGVAYGIEGSVSEQSTGYEKTMNRLREFFKRDIQTTDTLRVMAEQAMAKAKGKVTIERGVPIVSGVNADEQAQEAKQEGLVIEVPPKAEVVAESATPVAEPISPVPSVQGVSGDVTGETVAPPASPVSEEAQAEQMSEPAAEPPMPPAEESPVSVSQPTPVETQAEQTPTSETQPKPAGVPTMITKDMEAKLKAKGYGKVAINQMTPQQAWDILNKAPEMAPSPQETLITQPEIPLQAGNRTGTTRPSQEKERGETNVGGSTGQPLNGLGDYVDDDEVNMAISVASGRVREGMDAVAKEYRKPIERMVKEFSDNRIELEAITGFPYNDRANLGKIVLGRPIPATSISQRKLDDVSKFFGAFKKAADYVLEGDVYVYKPQEIVAEQAKNEPVVPEKAPKGQEIATEATEMDRAELDKKVSAIVEKQRAFGEELAKKYGAPVKPIRDAEQPYGDLGRLENMLEDAATKSKDPAELAKILDAASGMGQESRIVWAILNNPYTSEATAAEAKKNDAVRAMTTDENIASLDKRRADLRKQIEVNAAEQAKKASAGLTEGQIKALPLLAKTRGQISNLAGPGYSKLRQSLYEMWTGQNLPAAKTGINALRDAIYKSVPFPEDANTINAKEKFFAKWVDEQIAANEAKKETPAPAKEAAVPEGKKFSVFRMTKNGEERVPVEGVAFELKDVPAEFFMYQEDKRWYIYETSTGKKVASGDTKAEVRENAIRTKERIAGALKLAGVLKDSTKEAAIADVEKMTAAVRKANEQTQAQIEKSGIDIEAPPLTKQDVVVGETVYDVKGRPWTVSKSKKMVPSFSQDGIQGVQSKIVAGQEYPITTNTKTDWGYTSEDITTWRRPQQKPQQQKEATNAESIRSDEGQVRQGREEGQPGVQRGASQGGRNLEQQAPQEPGGKQEKVSLPKAGTRVKINVVSSQRGETNEVEGSILYQDSLPDVPFVAYKFSNKFWKIVEFSTGMSPGDTMGETKAESLKKLADNIEKVGVKTVREAISRATVLNTADVTPPTSPSPKKPISTPPAREPDAQTSRPSSQSPDVSAREGGSIATAELNPDFRQVLSKQIRSLIPRQEQVERSFGRGQWKGYITRATEGNDVLRGFAKERHAGGNTAWVKPALAKAETAADLKAIADKLDASIAKEAAPVAQVPAAPAPVARIPKGAKVVTTYDENGVSFSGEFVRDNGDGTATFRAFGSRPKKGLFRRFGVDAQGVQITKEMTVPSDTLKATEPMGDLNRMTPAQREAYKAMTAAQDARMEAEIAAGRSVNADELTRRAMAEERRQAAKEDGIRMRQDQTDTPAFRDWFGDSKVVDADGKPRVVYHGTGNNFTVFNGQEQWFSRDRDYAEEMSIIKGEPNVVEAYVRIENPLTVTMDISEFGVDYYEEEHLKRANEEGRDGVIFTSDDGNFESYVTFSPSQIKSATANTGAFDPANPDIRFSMAKEDEQGGNVITSTMEEYHAEIRRRIKNALEKTPQKAQFFEQGALRDDRSGYDRLSAIEDILNISGGSTAVPVIIHNRHLFTADELTRLFAAVEDLDPARRGVTVDSFAKKANIPHLIDRSLKDHGVPETKQTDKTGRETFSGVVVDRTSRDFDRGFNPDYWTVATPKGKVIVDVSGATERWKTGDSVTFVARKEGFFNSRGEALRVTRPSGVIITEMVRGPNDVIRVKEDDFEGYKDMRIARGYTDIVTVDASMLKKGFEEYRKEDLVHTKSRLEELRGVKELRSYPLVSGTFDGRDGVDIANGRHRIAMAASRGKLIEVAMHPEYPLPSRYIFKTTSSTTETQSGADGIRFSMQQEDDAKKQRAKATFDRLLPLMDNPVDEYRSPEGIPIVQPQVLDKAQLDRIVKAFDADAELPTPSSVNRKAQIQDALSTMNESEIRDTVSAIANDRRDWDVDDDTLFKMRLFLMKREGDVASYKGQMDAAERNGDAGRINMISDMTAGAEYDIVQTANALSKAGSKRGQALQTLQTGMDRDYNIVYRVRQFRKTTGRDVSVEDYRRIAEQATKDAAEQKKNYDELRKALAEEEKKRFEDAIAKARKEFDAKVLEAYRKGAAEERSSFEYLLNDPDAEPIRRLDPAAGFEGIDIGGVAFRVEDSQRPSPQATYPGALRDLARKVFTEVQSEGLGVTVFGQRMLVQGRAKGFKGDMIARYVYDFSKRLGIAEVTPTKKMPTKAATSVDAKGKPRKFKTEKAERDYFVKDAVKRAVAEDLTASGDKVVERALAILDEEKNPWSYLTKDEVYGVVTGYPTVLEPDTRDQVEKRYAMIRRHIHEIQKQTELKNGVYPTKMTLGNDAPDVTLRQLSREVRDMMNNFTFPADAEDPRLMNAQKALANRLQYAVEELQKAVDTGTPINEKAPRAVEETPEIKRLRATLRDLRAAYEAMPSVEAIREVRDTERARRSANKRYHFWAKRLEDAKNGVFPETFKGTETAEKDAEIASYKAKAEAAQREYWQIKKASPQERLAVLTEKVTKAEERLASLEEALAQTPVADPSKPKTPFVPANAEEAAAQAKLEAARQAIDNVRKAIQAKWRDENAEAIYKVKEAERFQYLTQKAAAIEKKIKDRDFTKAPKRQPVTSGRIVIAQEKVRQGQRTIEERIQWEANQAAGWTGKAKNIYNMSGNLYRFFKASYDISNVGVQSARLFTAHPLIGARLIRDSVSNSFSDEKMAEYMAAMHMDPDYEKAYNDGLALDQQFDDYFGAGMGESVFRGFVERARTGGVFTRIGGALAQGSLISQRAFDIYGRAMRFEVYKSIVNDPAHASLSPIQRKAVANMVNIMGGIGNTKMYNHNFAAVLSNLMWSSRLFTAQIQTAIGGGGLLWNAGLGPEGSKANTGREWYETAAPGALKLYARSIAGNIALAQVFAAVGMLLGDRQPWEDEETLFWKAYNFLFGRPVIGAKNFDFSGGLTTYTALARKFMDGTHVAMSGRDVSDEGFAGKVKLLSNFFRGRLRPDLAIVLNVAFGEDVTGEKFGPRGGMEGMSNMLWETAIPITPLALYETTTDLAKTHGWSGIAFGLVPSLAGDVFGFAKGGQPRDARYEIERHKSHMGQVNKALKVAKETGDTSEYIRLRDLYLFDVGVSKSVEKLDAAGKKALKVADDKRYPEATREKAKADAERMFATARDILLGNRK